MRALPDREVARVRLRRPAGARARARETAGPTRGRSLPLRAQREARVAHPEEVVAATGFEPGAVAPFPAGKVERVLVEHGLLMHELVWVGAGTARHMAGLTPFDLVRVAKAEPADLIP